MTSRTRGVVALFAVALVALMIASVAAGPSDVRIPVRDVVSVILSHIPGGGSHPVTFEGADAIVWEVRLPRVIAASLVGALLALSGVALQGMLMNPLADPYTVGVSAGAAVGAAIAEVTGLGLALMGLGGVALAFGTALAAVTLVYSLARVDGRVSVHTFLLAGVVVGTLLWSAIPLVMVVAGKGQDLQRIYFYLIGTLQGADWTRTAILAPFAVAAAVCLRLWAAELNLMTMGEESALHLGVNTESLKRRVLTVGSLATAAAVSVAGIVGFVGLVVPHGARRLVGPDHRDLLPVSALLGAALLVGADLVVRAWLNDMPVGVVTAVVGAPLFCLLLRRRRAVAW